MKNSVISEIRVIPIVRRMLVAVIAMVFTLPLLAQQSFDVLQDADILVYKHASDIDLKVSIVYPDGYNPKKKYPAIIFFFGGGWSGGTVQQFDQHCRYFASRGMIAMTANYRVETRNGTTPFESVEDARSALRWMKIHADELGIHKKKIIAAGGSAGGHLALCTATIDGVNCPDDDLSFSPVPNALVLFNPVVNTMPEGYGFDRLGDRARELSPFHHIGKHVPPTIIFHGDKDTTVPLDNVQEFCREMKECKNRCELVVFEDQKHGFFNYGRENNKYYKLTVAAADKFLQSLGYLSKMETIEIFSE